MPRRRASRPWDGRNHSGGSRAAEPVADVALLTIEPGQAFVARLRDALEAAPDAKRYLIHTEPGSPSPVWGEHGSGYPISVVAVPMSDTCKEVIDGVVRRTVPRDSLVTISGPWVFTREALTDGLARVEGRERDITELVAFCETARLKVRVLGG